jgi:hypothetical protein
MSFVETIKCSTLYQKEKRTSSIIFTVRDKGFNILSHKCVHAGLLLFRCCLRVGGRKTRKLYFSLESNLH